MLLNFNVYMCMLCIRGKLHLAPSHGSSEIVESDKCSFAKDEDYYGPESRDIVAVSCVCGEPVCAGVCYKKEEAEACTHTENDICKKIVFIPLFS
jgi:hypothetical protein